MTKSPRRGFLALFFVLGLAVTGALSSLSAQSPAQDSPSKSVLRGRVTLLGKPPEEKVVTIDPKSDLAQGEVIKSRFYVVGPDQGLKDVVVKVVGLPQRQWPVPAEPLVIASRRGLFEPYISAMQLGQKLSVINEGMGLHNVHIRPTKGKERVSAQMRDAKPLEFDLTEPEDFVSLKVDVYPWMFAFVTVVDHPFFAVTDAKGQFEIKGLPPGKYQLVAMHRKAGTQSTEVEIGENGGSANFQFKVNAPE